MPQLTDPARELAELCERLASSSSKRGDLHLAELFDVAPWSREFYQIVFTIVDRCDFVISIVETLELDDDFRGEAVAHIQAIKAAFDYDAMANVWSHRGLVQLNAANVQPLKMLCYPVRAKISFPRLNEEEIADVLAMVIDLETWLAEQQLSEHDFIRQAIIEGVSQFRFRLERVGWLGWGYTIASLREVVSAYYTLHSVSNGPAENPDAEAVLAKVRSFVQATYEKTKVGKDVVETVDAMLKVYGAAVLTINAIPGVAGLLRHG
jgi:hypothetical protein